MADHDINEVLREIAILKNDSGYIKDGLGKIQSLVENKYVTKTEFEPIKRIVYGMVGLILTAVVGALVALVVI